MACLKSVGPAHDLPRLWLERVLNFDAKAVGTVRRSAGIPFAICAVLRAEAWVCNKRDANPPLVTLAIRVLLQSASVPTSASSAYYVTQVHHLNILRHLMRDASLCNVLRPFLEQILLLALRMWAHREWSIRNSASLLFASAIRKLIVHDPDSEDSAELSTTTIRLKMFEFSAFRLQYGALMGHLALAMRAHAEAIDAPLDAFSDLFPMLLILKKLHADAADDFSDNLRRCCVILAGHR